MRSLLSALALTLLAVVVGVGSGSAQQTDRIYKIVTFVTGLPVEKWTGPPAAFRDALRDRGYVVGKNLVIEVRHGDGEVARLATVAETVVASKPDVILTFATAPTVAAMQATKTIPIIFSGVGGPVEKGIVASLAKPGGNATGTVGMISNAKMWQLLHEIAPATRRAGFLVYAPNTLRGISNPFEYRADMLSRNRRDAEAAGIELIDMFVDTRDELEAKLAELAAGGNAGIFIVTDPVLFSWRSSILNIASRYSLPTVCAQWLEWAAEGCLATYGEDPYEERRDRAGQVDKVPKGTKPADIPVQQPTKINLIINAKTAKTLGLTVPPAVLAVADEVIE
jgi:putative ABC transport system substrate-binding protein